MKIKYKAKLTRPEARRRLVGGGGGGLSYKTE